VNGVGKTRILNRCNYFYDIGNYLIGKIWSYFFEQLPNNGGGLNYLKFGKYIYFSYFNKMDDEDNELEIPEPVSIGDLIVLKATQGYDGYLCGNQAEMHVAMQVSSKQQFARDSLEFDSHAFRICPSLNYRHRHEMQSRSKIPVKPSNVKSLITLVSLARCCDWHTSLMIYLYSQTCYVFRSP